MHYHILEDRFGDRQNFVFDHAKQHVVARLERDEATQMTDIARPEGLHDLHGCEVRATDVTHFAITGTCAACVKP